MRQLNAEYQRLKQQKKNVNIQVPIYYNNYDPNQTNISYKINPLGYSGLTGQQGNKPDYRNIDLKPDIIAEEVKLNNTRYGYKQDSMFKNNFETSTTAVISQNNLTQNLPNGNSGYTNTPYQSITQLYQNKNLHPIPSYKTAFSIPNHDPKQLLAFQERLKKEEILNEERQGRFTSSGYGNKLIRTGQTVEQNIFDPAVRHLDLIPQHVGNINQVQAQRVLQGQVINQIAQGVGGQNDEDYEDLIEEQKDEDHQQYEEEQKIQNVGSGRIRKAFEYTTNVLKKSAPKILKGAIIAGGVGLAAGIGMNYLDENPGMKLMIGEKLQEMYNSIPTIDQVDEHLRMLNQGLLAGIDPQNQEKNRLQSIYTRLNQQLQGIDPNATRRTLNEINDIVQYVYQRVPELFNLGKEQLGYFINQYFGRIQPILESNAAQIIQNQISQPVTQVVSNAIAVGSIPLIPVVANKIVKLGTRVAKYLDTREMKINRLRGRLNDLLSEMQYARNAQDEQEQERIEQERREVQEEYQRELNESNENDDDYQSIINNQEEEIKEEIELEQEEKLFPKQQQMNNLLSNQLQYGTLKKSPFTQQHKIMQKIKFLITSRKQLAIKLNSDGINIPNKFLQIINTTNKRFDLLKMMDNTQQIIQNILSYKVASMQHGQLTLTTKKLLLQLLNWIREQIQDDYYQQIKTKIKKNRITSNPNFLGP